MKKMERRRGRWEEVKGKKKEEGGGRREEMTEDSEEHTSRERTDKAGNQGRPGLTAPSEAG